MVLAWPNNHRYRRSQDALRDPGAVVTIRLYARTKIKITVSTGQNRRVYRSRIALFGERGISATLHRGPVHIAPDDPNDLERRFALIILENIDPKTINIYEDGDAPHFMRPGTGAPRPLPPTFDFGNFWLTSDVRLTSNIISRRHFIPIPATASRHLFPSTSAKLYPPSPSPTSTSSSTRKLGIRS